METPVGDRTKETPLTILSEAEADLVGSKTLVTVTVISNAEGTAGAVYRPVGEIVPTVVLPPGIPLTDQTEPELEAGVIFAVNCWV